MTGVLHIPLLGLTKIASAVGRAADAARLIGMHDVVAGHASVAVNPYFAHLVYQAAETASGQLGGRGFAAERDAARQIQMQHIAAEAWRIAHEMAADA